MTIKESMKRSIEYDCSIQDCQQKKRVTEERDKQNRAMDGLITEAECIVYLDIPRGNVNGCKNGHILCHSCETKMRAQNNGHIFNCPECRIHPSAEHCNNSKFRPPKNRTIVLESLNKTNEPKEIKKNIPGWPSV